MQGITQEQKEQIPYSIFLKPEELKVDKVFEPFVSKQFHRTSSTTQPQFAYFIWNDKDLEFESFAFLKTAKIPHDHPFLKKIDLPSFPPFRRYLKPQQWDRFVAERSAPGSFFFHSVAIVPYLRTLFRSEELLMECVPAV